MIGFTMYVDNMYVHNWFVGACSEAGATEGTTSSASV